MDERVEIAIEEGSDAEEDALYEIGTDVDDPFHDDDDSGDFPLANDEGGSHPVKLVSLEGLESADLWNPEGHAALESLGEQAVSLEEEEDMLNGSLAESLSPRSPNRRNSITCPPPPPACSIIKKSGEDKDEDKDEDEDEDDGSDWDSEDEGEESEESTGIKVKLKEFFQKMIGSLGPEPFETALQSSQHPGRSWMEELADILDLELDT